MTVTTLTTSPQSGSTASSVVLISSGQNPVIKNLQEKGKVQEMNQENTQETASLQVVCVERGMVYALAAFPHRLVQNVFL